MRPNFGSYLTSSRLNDSKLADGLVHIFPPLLPSTVVSESSRSLCNPSITREDASQVPPGSRRAESRHHEFDDLQ